MWWIAQSVEVGTLALALIGSTLTGLAAGAMVGYRFGRRRTPCRHNLSRLRSLATELSQWTAGVSNDVGNHQAIVQALTEQIVALEHPNPQSAPTAASLLFEKLLAANRLLQSRLHLAEATLQQQARDLSISATAAHTDPLTALSNRRHFDEVLQQGLAAGNARGTPVGLLLFDIDHFKVLNDTHGHLAGDAVLRQLAALLRQVLPVDSVLARLGGEEFACVLVGRELSHLANCADEARIAVESQPFRFEQQSLRVTTSCGVAQAMFREEPVALLKRADAALYAAKEHGRNAVCLHDGYRCVLHRQGEANASEATVSAEAAATNDLREICHDLRQRLDELARQPVDEAATS